jgi:RecQ family ATP-dependent DNA helicase
MAGPQTKAEIEDALRAGLNALGWPGLRDHQIEPLRHILAGSDVLCILPTGGGKSALFQLPALCEEGTTLVLSPLIALMMDQVERLNQHGIAAATLNSTLNGGQRQRILLQLQAGEMDLLYCSPEGLSRMDRRIFGETPIARVVVDEAHCVSEHGWDFRPDYRKIDKALVRMFGSARPPILAVTATATDDVADDIEKTLGMNRVERIRGTSNRPEIYLGVAGPQTELLRMVQRGGTPTVIYSATRQGTETAATEMSNAGFAADCYHAGLTKKDRWSRQCAFQGGDLEILTATCAYGMGVDGIIRSVIHLEMPTSLEAFSQEAGRAGRDGEPSFSIVRATPEALDVALLFIDQTWPRPMVIRRFWTRLRRWFIQDTPRLEGQGVLHRTTREIGEAFGVDAGLVRSCLRILTDAGHIEKIGVSELPMVVRLGTEAATLPLGSDPGDPDVRFLGRVQAQVMAQLESFADANGLITGSKSFFLSLGLDPAMARSLQARNRLSIDKWPTNQPVIRQLDDDDLRISDRDLDAIRTRQLQRVGWARSFLSERTCRREVLLRYFGSAGVVGGGHCCDLCTRSGREARPFDGQPPLLENAS